MPPFLSSTARSPHVAQDCRTPSPNYFGFISDPSSNPTDSNLGFHAKTSPSPSSSTVRSTALPSPKVLPFDSNPPFEAFRRQSETKAFNLGHGNLSQFSRSSPPGQRPSTKDMEKEVSGQSPRSVPPSGSERQNGFEDRMEIDSENYSIQSSHKAMQSNFPSFFDIPREESPATVPFSESPQLQKTQLSHLDERHSRLSLPYDKLDPPSPSTISKRRAQQRADTLPTRLQSDGPLMVSCQDFVDLLKSSPQDVLLLDLRVYPQYSQSRISGAINLCIPTTLLKRPSFNVQKLADTFTIEAEKDKFARWKNSRVIVVYDGSSSQMKDAVSSVNTLKKFTNEGWTGNACVLRGGFAEFSSKFPDMIDWRPSSEIRSSSTKTLSIEPAIAGIAPVAGGCVMPSTKTAANPFFGNIRQNMDLIGGVGQMPIKHPAALTEQKKRDMPSWLLQASDNKDGGKTVSDRFLVIEKAEQRRLQKALSGNVSYGSPTPDAPKSVQIAGIEKGAKNRYNNIWPYDHARVRLQGVPGGGCDYINASHVKAAWTNKHYIATQAPMPATFEDFWRVVWEQNARVIVMLTAESEGGQLKSHPYWKGGDYGLLKLKSLSEKCVSLDHSRPSFKPSNSYERPSMGRRRSTNPTTPAGKDVHQDAKSLSTDTPHLIVRKLALSHAAHPFAPVHEITQLHYSCWPDFGAPAHPVHVLGLVEQCDAAVRSTANSHDPSDPEPAGQRPVLVHCSAGCGRTGTFCTVDSVLDMLKRQRRERAGKPQKAEMDIDSENWVNRDDLDLIAKTVEDLRDQRLSMVQSLKQFVLCYETVLEWLVEQQAEKQDSGGK
ncbi:MAG: hypothetical protein M1830_001923 [Pleopsidium flavum]|nr:MAG: hypothetical protein M1830_001923 [Pleopsidium flavum]